MSKDSSDATAGSFWRLVPAPIPAPNTAQPTTSTSSSRPSYYPLTTIWTAVPPCSSIVPAWFDFHIEPCQIPHFVEVFGYDAYYSPGICPSGYSIGCPGSELNLHPVLPSETVAMCVPSSWACYTSILNLATTALTWMFATPRQGASISGAIPGETMLAPAIEVRWQSTDLSSLETTPTADWLTSHTESNVKEDPSTGVISRTNSGTIGPTTTQGDPVDPSRLYDPNTKLPPGVIAGIAVGAVVLVLLLIAVIITMFRRRRRHFRAHNDGVPELDSTAIYEKDSTPVAEKDSEPISINHSSGRGGTTDPIPLATMVELDGSPQGLNNIPELIQDHDFRVKYRASIERRWG